MYLAQNDRGETRIIPVRGEPRATFDPDEVMALARGALGDRIAELRLMEQYDAYSRGRLRQRPLPVVYVRLNDAVSSRHYINPKTARSKQRHNSGSQPTTGREIMRAAAVEASRQATFEERPRTI